MRPKLRYTPQSLQSAASMLHSIIGPLSKTIINQLMQAAIGQMISDHRYRNGKNRGIEASGIRQQHSLVEQLESSQKRAPRRPLEARKAGKVDRFTFCKYLST